uniref:Peptidase S1 domain-containing protein n=1 Tax=Parastrongyloides trichosuri TaxID=131310 RepID=A0A0N4ZL56_PARTI
MLISILLFYSIIYVECHDWTTHPGAHLLITTQVNGNKNLSCSGIILGSKYVLTAAHCLFNQSPCKKKGSDFNNNYNNFIISKHDIVVEYGGDCSTKKTSCVKNNKMKKVGVEKINIHKEYIESKCKEADLAIVELGEKVGNRGVILNTYISSLPEKLIGFGYGENLNDCNKSYMYQEGYFKTIKCKHNPSKLPKGTFCTDEKYRNFCKGDSGAPLISQNRTLYGVVSSGTNCILLKKHWEKGNEELLKGNISFKVAYFINFICSIVQQDKENPVKGCEKYKNVSKE